MQKKNIAILFGGCSSEYAISLQSAYAVLTHMDTQQYQPICIGITKQGHWLLYEGDFCHLLDDTWQQQTACTPAILSPDRVERGILAFRSEIPDQITIDAAFPILHGKNGEDGTIQGLLELAGIPIIGCGVLASALGMDKDLSHTLAQAAGVAAPNSIVLYETDKSIALQRCQGLCYPLFVKPAREGSSFGITKVETSDQLLPAIDQAFRYDHKIVIEENVPGFEVGCAILGSGNQLIIGEVDEIQLTQGWLDYQEKYQERTAQVFVPARIPAETADRIKAAAVAIYQALQCSGFARVDLFLTPQNQIVFNEINTTPGLTTHSRYPNMLAAAGISFEEMLQRLFQQVV